MIFVGMKIEFFQNTQLIAHIVIELTAVNRHIVIGKRIIAHTATYQLNFTCCTCTGFMFFCIRIASRIQSNNVV